MAQTNPCDRAGDRYYIFNHEFEIFYLSSSIVKEIRIDGDIENFTSYCCRTGERKTGRDEKRILEYVIDTRNKPKGVGER